MSAHPPPVPEEQRAPHGTDKSPKGEAADHRRPDRDPREQGRQGNLAQNTTNQGLQLDR